VSVGISEFPHDGNTRDTLIKNADVAMYRAKAHGGNCYEIFSANVKDSNGSSSRNNQTESDKQGEEVKK
jgi:predicted signal transduction protein with EAL and GGDEF domain